MIPFAPRWLHAELPAKLGKRHETLDRFYMLLHVIRKTLGDKSSNTSSASVELWRKRENLVINSIISHHLSYKEFGVCLALIKDLISRSDDSDMDAKAVLLSKLGYVQMQYGDLEGAKNTFGKIEVMVNEGKSEVELLNLVSRNKALMDLVVKDYVSAVREYDVCIETIVVNLCSMYELAYVNHSDIKRTLSNWIARVAPDDFDSSCTRI